MTVALLAGVVVFVVWRQAGGELGDIRLSRASSVQQEREEQPRSAIYRMLDAARAGDGDAYIACHTGAMARSLEQSRDEMTPEGFSEYLRKRNSEIKGIAILEPKLASADKAQVDVEYVYADRKEGQRFYLIRSDGTWKIEGVDSAVRVENPVPYGTPVY